MIFSVSIILTFSADMQSTSIKKTKVSGSRASGPTSTVRSAHSPSRIVTDFDVARKRTPPPVPPPPYNAVVRAGESSPLTEESPAPPSYWDSPMSTCSTLVSEDELPTTPQSAQLYFATSSPASPRHSVAPKRPLPAIPSPASASSSQAPSRQVSQRRPSSTLKPPSRSQLSDAIRLQFALEASLTPSMYATWFGFKAQFPCGCAPCPCAEGNNAHPRHLPCPIQPGRPIERNCGA